MLNVQDIFMAGNDNNYYLSIIWVHRSVKTLSGKFLTAAILNNYANKLIDNSPMNLGKGRMKGNH